MKLVFVPLKDVFKECKGKRQFSIKKDAYRRFSSVSNEMQICIKKIAALYTRKENVFTSWVMRLLIVVSLAWTGWAITLVFYLLTVIAFWITRNQMAQQVAA